jgi:glutaryl-CoA dehydrogenase
MIADRDSSPLGPAFQEFTLPTTPPPTDYYLIDELVKPQEREVRDRVRQWVDREVIPIAAGYWDRAEFPFEIIPKLRELNLTGDPIRGYGSPGLSLVAAGLVAQEFARGDASIATFYGVHSGLAMGSIGSSARANNGSAGCRRWRGWKRSARSR